MHHQFKRCSYLRSSTTQLPSKVSASHRRTVVAPSIVFHFFSSSSVCLFLRFFFRFVFLSFLPSLWVYLVLTFGCSSFFCFFTFVSAHWQTLVNVYMYLLSSGYTLPCPYVQTCSCLHTTFTPRCCSRLCSCVSACSRHSGIIKGYSTALE